MQIDVYSRSGCSWCEKAKSYLTRNQIPYNEIIVGTDITVENVKEKFPGVTTLPIILLDNVLIGGYSQLVERVK